MDGSFGEVNTVGVIRRAARRGGVTTDCISTPALLCVHVEESAVIGNDSTAFGLYAVDVNQCECIVLAAS